MPNDAKELSVHVTEESIALLIDRFYVRIRQDPVLAEVFEAAIAPDEWPEHLATMRRFWSSAMLTSGVYSGKPVAVHRGVRGLTRPMFAHWLALFDEIVSELFAPAISTQFATKAHSLPRRSGLPRAWNSCCSISRENHRTFCVSPSRKRLRR